ncbi:hypothetical protein K488DRAFT_81819 [Vararia minispora EC-137]|uniref:Uncharacterized protein n=1 Tax=Vararia minispora EC-137 TaxID=1314806 RepID=A0ACB8QZ47_9AGAM|nr:hypothetical protein K488DRAFT_81819 [Vararia minispora EC-137]
MATPLFTGNVRRNFTLVAIAVASAHAIARVIPLTLRAMTLSQTVVALLALSALSVFVYEHHRRAGNLLTIQHEEYVLIATVSLAWLVVLIAWRAIMQNSAGAAISAPVVANTRDGRHSRGWGRNARGGWPYGCAPDDMYCVYEEWSFL